MAAANWRPEPLTSVSHYTEALGLLMFDKQNYRLVYIEILIKDRKYFYKSWQDYNIFRKSNNRHIWRFQRNVENISIKAAMIISYSESGISKVFLFLA